jgi:hypothetical protein
MPISDTRDVAPEGWSLPLHDGRPAVTTGAAPAHEGVDTLPSAPESGTRERARGTWLRRLLGAVLPAREAAGARAARGAAEALEGEGGMVFANLGGWPRPPVVGGFVPDVYAVFEDREVVLDVVRGEGKRRDVAFAAWAEGGPRRVYQQIAVGAGRAGRGS